MIVHFLDLCQVFIPEFMVWLLKTQLCHAIPYLNVHRRKKEKRRKKKKQIVFIKAVVYIYLYIRATSAWGSCTTLGKFRCTQPHPIFCKEPVGVGWPMTPRLHRATLALHQDQPLYICWERGGRERDMDFHIIRALLQEDKETWSQL